MNTHLQGLFASLSSLNNGLGNLEFELSIYRYIPQKIKDEREIYNTVNGDIVKLYRDIYSIMDKESEIAIHSRVKRDGASAVYHIPMIDFSCSLAEIKVDELSQVMREFNIRRGLLYSSGRSFHMYSIALLDACEWQKFMGRILLINKPSGIQIVDSRWVGHRLMAGYGALRLTHNSNSYLSSPSLVDEIIV